MTYRIFLSNSELYIDYLADSFTMALEMFVEDGGNMERDINHVEELPRRRQYKAAPEEFPLFI